MGMTKNTGKTVALNHLLAQAAQARLALAAGADDGAGNEAAP